MGKEGSARDNSQKFLGEGREPCGKGFSSIGISLQYRNGRRARLRIWFREDWRSKSSRADHLFGALLGVAGHLLNPRFRAHWRGMDAPTLAKKLGMTTH